MKAHKLGAHAIVIDITSLNSGNFSIVENFKKLISLTEEIPIGIAESETVHLSVDHLKVLVESEKLLFYIDNCGSLKSMQSKISVTDKIWFRSFTGSLTAFGISLSYGFCGYAGLGASFIPKLLSWYYDKRETAEKSLTSGLEAFMSISEPTVKVFFPQNLKIFLKFHEKTLEEFQPVSRIDLMSFATEENVSRITHFHEAAEFAEKAISGTVN